MPLQQIQYYTNTTRRKTDNTIQHGEKLSAGYRISFRNTGGAAESMIIDLGGSKRVKGFRFLPTQDGQAGIPLDYTLSAYGKDRSWTVLAKGEFSNIVNNPIWQTISFNPTECSRIRLECSRITSGSRIYYNDVEVLFAE